VKLVRADNADCVPAELLTESDRQDLFAVSAKPFFVSRITNDVATRDFCVWIPLQRGALGNLFRKFGGLTTT